MPQKTDQTHAATPMMQQYTEIKSVHPDSLLFYRMGDFYELFFHDAEVAARALGIALTKRGKHLGEDIPMCGVPVHAAEDYLQRLIGLGHRVAVCEQTEDPAEAKKRGSKAVVRREVIRLVTPGTITEEKLLDPGRSNYLCALARNRESTGDEYGIAWIDISTGQFRVQASGLRGLGPVISRIDPRELILSEKLYHEDGFRERFHLDDGALTLEPSGFFDSQSAEKRMCDFFEVAMLDGLGGFSRAETAAAGAILAYLEKTQLAEKPVVMRPQREEERQNLFIDAATRTNLELLHNQSGDRKGSLFSAINETVTGPGSRLLCDRMMSPLCSASAIAERLDSVSLFFDDPDLCADLRVALKPLPDISRAVSRLSLNRGGPRDLLAVRAGLEIAELVAERFSLVDQLPDEIDRCITVLRKAPRAILDMLGEMLGDEVPLLARDGGFILSGFHAELDELRKLRDESRQVIAGMQSQYAEATGVKSLKIRHNNVLGYFVEVTAGNADSLTSDEGRETFIHRQTLANAMRFTTTELAEMESRIANAAGKALDIELALFENLRSEVVFAADKLGQVANALAILDVSQSLAQLARLQSYCRPMVDESLAFEIENGRHPVVEQVLRNEHKDPFISNDCNIGGDHAGQTWLLTGPNMGGKSTYLRQNALIAILAQMGSFVPASRAHIGVIDQLFSRVGAADDLARGRSTFMVEMVETAAILNQAGSRSFVILDEIGRGTATFDGLSIAWAAIEHLHEVNCCRTLFATHYHELTSLAEALPRLSNVTLKVKEWEGDVIFLHEVVTGTADRSYGIQVAKLAGLPQAVVERARAVLDQLEDAQRSDPASNIVDDLPLFTAEPRPAKSIGLTESDLHKRITEVVPDELTPREALELVYELRQLVLQNRKD